MRRFRSVDTEGGHQVRNAIFHWCDRTAHAFFHVVFINERQDLWKERATGGIAVLQTVIPCDDWKTVVRYEANVVSDPSRCNRPPPALTGRVSASSVHRACME